MFPTWQSLPAWQQNLLCGMVGWCAGLVTLWFLGAAAVSAERRRDQSPESSPWYLEDQGTAEQKKFLDKIQKGSVARRTERGRPQW